MLASLSSVFSVWGDQPNTTVSQPAAAATKPGGVRKNKDKQRSALRAVDGNKEALACSIVGAPPPILKTPVRKPQFPAPPSSRALQSQPQQRSATRRKDDASWKQSLATLRTGEVVHAATAAAAAAASRFATT